MSGFADYHPVAILTYFITVLSITMFVNHPVLLLLSSLGGWLLHWFNRSTGSIRGLMWDMGLFVIIAIANPLFNHRGQTMLFFINGKPVTYEAIVYGIFMAVMMMAVFHWCNVFTRIMTSDKLLYLFGKITPNLSVVLSMAIRFVPMFRRQAQKVNQSQKAIGLYEKERSMDKIRGVTRVFSGLLTWSFENAIDTACSMRARGYGIGKRTQYSIFHITSRDIILMVSSILLALITLLGKPMGCLEFEYYPKVSAITLSTKSFLVYASYGLLALLPIIIDRREKLRWTYYRSKI